MLATLLSYTYLPERSITAMVINILTFIIISLLLLFRSSTRNVVGFSAFIGTLSGLIYTILIKIATDAIFRETTAFPVIFIFYTIYLSFAFVPGLIGFHRISKPSSFSRFLVYFGYIYAIAIISVGIAITIIIAMAQSDGASNASGAGLNGMFLFIQHSGWGFFVVYVLSMVPIFNNCSGKSRTTLLIYSTLNTLSVVVNPIVFRATPVSSDPTTILRIISVVSLVFFDIPIAIAFVIAAYYGHLWKSDSETTDEENV